MGAKTELFVRKQSGGVFTVVREDVCTGEIFFVHSGTGTDATGYGKNPDAPLATIDYAIGLCTANKGDRIYVMPGHNEGLGNAQIAVDVAGVSIIGLGRGSLRPRIDFDHANASIDVAASGCMLKNIVLFPSVTDVLIGIDINTLVTDTLIEDVEAIPGEDGGGVDDFALGIDIKVGCSRTVIRRYKQRQHASGVGYIAGIRLTGASDDVIIEDPDIVIKGTAAVAPINGITTLSTNVHIRRGTLVSDDEPGIELLTGTTGVIKDTDIFSDLGTIAAATVADGVAHFRVRYVEVGNESDAIVKTASIDD
jgi:hypothetical protein